MSALPCHGAYPRGKSHPVGQRGFEELYEHLPHVMPYPFVEDGTEEMAPGLGCHGEIRELRSAFCIGLCLHDGGELQVAALQFVAEEAVEVKGIGRIEVVDHGHGIPLHVKAVQQVDAPAHLGPGGPPAPVPAVLVVKLLRPVDADPHEPLVVVQEPGPLLREERAVRLDAVVYLATGPIVLLPLQGALVERERAQKRFPAVPGELYHGRGLCLDVFPHETLQHGITHHHVLLPVE